MFTDENTMGFTEDECDDMNAELFRRLKSDELSGLLEDERKKVISEKILNQF